MPRTAIFILLLSLIAFSCGKEQFGGVKQQATSTASPIVTNSATSCSAFTYIKPKVDFLFLWDNSTSSIFINESTKAALNNTINLISANYDYRILLAPLMVSPTSSTNYLAKLVAENPSGLNSTAQAMLIPREQAANHLNYSYVAGSKEEGVSRSVALINENIPHGIFRAGAYLNVVVMSNQDDFSWQVSNPVVDAERAPYVNEQIHKLLCLRGNYTPSSGQTCTGYNLNLSMLRFHSIIAMNDFGNGNTCSNIQQWDKSLVYKEVSSRLYTAPYTNGFSPNDQLTRTDLFYDNFLKLTNYDSYNICNVSDFSKIFDGINSTITDTLIPHEYNFWPVASSGALAIDPNEISVSKNGSPITKLTTPVASGANGFTFTNSVYTNQNTRYAPTAGEPFTGYMIELHGSARVKYPDCLTVTTQNPKDFYGYIVVPSKPVESSINVTINGVAIPKSATNGWQLLKESGAPKYFASKNIKITSTASLCPTVSEPGAYCEGSPAEVKSGYILQVFGSAIYSNGASVIVTYDPQG